MTTFPKLTIYGVLLSLIANKRVPLIENGIKNKSDTASPLAWVDHFCHLCKGILLVYPRYTHYLLQYYRCIYYSIIRCLWWECLVIYQDYQDLS